jgi:hypothetical protein
VAPTAAERDAVAGATVARGGAGRTEDGEVAAEPARAVAGAVVSRPAWPRVLPPRMIPHNCRRGHDARQDRPPGRAGAGRTTISLEGNPTFLEKEIHMLSIGKRAASIGAAVAVIAVVGPAAAANAATLPVALPAPVALPTATFAGPDAAAFQAGTDAAVAGWHAGAVAAIGGMQAGADALSAAYGVPAPVIGAQGTIGLPVLGLLPIGPTP